MNFTPSKHSNRNDSFDLLREMALDSKKWQSSNDIDYQSQRNNVAVNQLISITETFIKQKSQPY